MNAKAAEEQSKQLYCLIRCYRTVGYGDDWMAEAILNKPSYYFDYYEDKDSFISDYKRKLSLIRDGWQEGLIPTKLIRRIISDTERKVIYFEEEPQEKIEGYISCEAPCNGRDIPYLTEYHSLDGLLKRLEDASQDRGVFQALAVIDLKSEIEK